MKYIFFLITTVAALSRPWTTHSDLSFPTHLEKRLMSGRNARKKSWVHYENRPLGRQSGRADSPAKEGDTRASAKVTGPGRVATAREKNKNTEIPLDVTPVTSGQVLKEETHDPIWSKAKAFASGEPSRGAATQSSLLHPAKVEGTGKSGSVTITPPREGGYAKLKKEVDGEVVKDERIPAGQVLSDTHTGTRPGELKYTASSSRGGNVRVDVNN